jgi:hypothetical protein
MVVVVGEELEAVVGEVVVAVEELEEVVEVAEVEVVD